MLWCCRRRQKYIRLDKYLWADCLYHSKNGSSSISLKVTGWSRERWSLGTDLYFSTELADNHRILILSPVVATQCFGRADLSAQNWQMRLRNTGYQLMWRRTVKTITVISYYFIIGVGEVTITSIPKLESLLKMSPICLDWIIRTSESSSAIRSVCISFE